VVRGQHEAWGRGFECYWPRSARFSREKLRDCRFFSTCFGVSSKPTSLSIWLSFQNSVVIEGFEPAMISESVVVLDHLIWSLDEENNILGADPVETGLDSSKPALVFQLSQMQEWIAPFAFLSSSSSKNIHRPSCLGPRWINCNSQKVFYPRLVGKPARLDLNYVLTWFERGFDSLRDKTTPTL
jgi:hypothetical protein